MGLIYEFSLSNLVTGELTEHEYSLVGTDFSAKAYANYQQGL